MANQIVKPQNVKGFRDFLPSEKRRRDYVTKKVTETFELFGFEPLETPTIEYASLLMGKYGDEADKLLYTFKDRGERDLALRYDQTVPTARVLIQYQSELPKYFRRYQIQNVFRADKPQKGRYREFTQCDLDIFNSTSPLADAEILAATYFAFKNVGYPKVRVFVNDRKILFQYLKLFETEKVSVLSVIQSIDKLEKIGSAGVIYELSKKGLKEDRAKEALQSIQGAKLSDNLREIISFAINLGIPKEDVIFTPSLARGLDYYTGMIFELIIPGYEVGSCAGGGRYDSLIEQLGGISVPAVGVAFGFDRMVDALENLKISDEQTKTTQVLITIFNQKTLTASLQLANELRKANVSTEIFPGLEKLDKQFKYADKKEIPYVIIIGPDEAKQNIVKLKTMKTGSQQKLNQIELINTLKNSD